MYVIVAPNWLNLLSSGPLYERCSLLLPVEMPLTVPTSCPAERSGTGSLLIPTAPLSDSSGLSRVVPFDPAPVDSPTPTIPANAILIWSTGVSVSLASIVWSLK